MSDAQSPVLTCSARRVGVVRLVLGESLLLVSVGMAIGLTVALAAGRFVATILFGLSPTDTSTIAIAMGAMFTIAMLACYLPARRAATVDPLVALHDE